MIDDVANANQQYRCGNSHTWTDEHARLCPLCDSAEVYLLTEVGDAIPV
jgi:hypothetical protein